MEAYALLFRRFGERHWWPADTPFEVVVGAILTQQTAWTNVERAICNLKARNLVELEPLANANEHEIVELIRPAGYYNQKTKRLLGVAKHILDAHGSLERMLNRPTEEVRAELLELNGIGPETADSILCYAGKHLKFVVDAYTYRLCDRLPILDIGICKNHNWQRYHKVQDFFENRLPKDLAIYREYHALIVECAKRYCKSKPDCSKITNDRIDKCPLARICKFYKTMKN